jgi:hypothetical protein
MAAAPEEDLRLSAADIKEARVVVMNRQRGGQSSNSENWVLRTAGLAQPAEPRNPPVRRGTSSTGGWVEGTGDEGAPDPTGCRPSGAVA